MNFIDFYQIYWNLWEFTTASIHLMGRIAPRGRRKVYVQDARAQYNASGQNLPESPRTCCNLV